MTKPLRKAIESIVVCLQEPKKVLEIGSWRERNQHEIADLRPLFPDSEFIGVDMRPGPGVDVVANGNRLPFKNNSFDLVFCLETLEHADRPWLVAKEIERVLTLNGVAIISSQQNFPIHKYPSDYFRYTPYGLAVLFEKIKDPLMIGISPPFADEVKTNPQAVIIVGGKRANPELKRKLRQQLLHDEKIISVHKPYRHRVQDSLKIFKRAIEELNFHQKVHFFK